MEKAFSYCSVCFFNVNMLDGHLLPFSISHMEYFLMQCKVKGSCSWIVFSFILLRISKWNCFSDKNKCWMGLNFIHGELIGWFDGCGGVVAS